jgi:hypothetical protein
MKRNVIHAVWIGCIFNGIHISAWNFSFASEPEQLLWRITSVGACAAVALMWAVTSIRPKVIGLVLAGLSAIFYCICRTYLHGGGFCWPAFGSRGVVSICSMAKCFTWSLSGNVRGLFVTITYHIQGDNVRVRFKFG